MTPRYDTIVHDSSRRPKEQNPTLMETMAALMHDWIDNLPGGQNVRLLHIINDARSWEHLRRRVRDLNQDLMDYRPCTGVIGSHSFAFEYWLEEDAHIDALMRGGSFRRPSPCEEHLYKLSSYEIETGEHEPDVWIAWIPL